ncbi:MAG: hypothetical protein OHK0019_09340 [Saprospiraceae bacterium]
MIKNANCIFRKDTLILLLCLLFCACQPIARLIYGVKKPREVSTQKIEKKAVELDIDTSALFAIRSEYYPKVINEVKSFPNIRIYDKAGNMYNYRENPEECKSTADDFIQNLRLDSAYNYVNDSSFFRLPLQLEGLRGEQFNIEALREADFYAFIFWATFLGKMNKDNVIPRTRLAKENRRAKIHLIYISCDLRDEWGDDYWKSWGPPPAK